MSRPSTDLEKASPSSAIELGELNSNGGASSSGPSAAGGASELKAEEEEAFLPQPTTSAPAAQPRKLSAAMISASSVSSAWPAWLAL